MSEVLAQLSDKKAMGLIDQVGDLFKDAPKLPPNFIDFLVKIAPYLAIISAVIMLLGGPLIGILGTFASLFTLSPLFMLWTIITAVCLIVEAVLQLLAFNPLKKLQQKGWIYLFWSEVVSLIGAIAGILNGGYINLVGTAIFTVIAFYILFQMRPSYKA